MSRNVRQCRGVLPDSHRAFALALALALALASAKRCLPPIHGREHIPLPEQHAAAGRAVTADLAGHQPSINRPYIDAAQLSDLRFRQ
jgi:hypothetical protein